MLPQQRFTKSVWNVQHVEYSKWNIIYFIIYVVVTLHSRLSHILQCMKDFPCMCFGSFRVWRRLINRRTGDHCFNISPMRWTAFQMQSLSLECHDPRIGRICGNLGAIGCAEDDVLIIINILYVFNPAYLVLKSRRQKHLQNIAGTNNTMNTTPMAMYTV